jgi:DNA-binding transcriptional MerR regulator
MPTEYSLQDLAKLADVTPRTIRFYIAQGLLPSPTQLGPAARYAEAHLDLLRLIKKLQAAHLPLAEIRNRLRAIPQDKVAQVAEATPDYEPADSAIDYVNRLLRPVPAAPAATPSHAMPAQSMRVPMPIPAPMPSMRMPREVAPAKPTAMEPDRAQWERITFGPDVELHVRRPLTRNHNKRVERLISIARELLEED